ncbi:MAG TPA: type II toxin-antitoxin system MqsA family antitoxin [Opitutaceae bacterium]|nr:type II toxin-antitoxin system MqsA family antitoxin [Opitutaceae bacterium]
MKETEFQNLLQGIRDAGAYMRGNKKVVTRVDRIDPGFVTAIRTKLNLSQKAFSAAFGISTSTLRNWEQGRRQPTGAARVLLRVAAKHPKAVLEAVE